MCDGEFATKYQGVSGSHCHRNAVKWSLKSHQCPISNKQLLGSSVLSQLIR